MTNPWKLQKAKLRVRAFRRGLFATRLMMESLVITGGFTYDLCAQDFVTEGFAVSVNPELTLGLNNVEYADVLDYIAVNQVVLNTPGKVLGGWLDTESGVTYLDVVTIVDSKELALDLAVQHGELAVYDIAGAQEIRTGLVK